jgi:hypothetical protein
MDETQNNNIPCTNHAKNITPDISKFTPEIQEKMKQMIQDFTTQYTSFNWEKFRA